MKKFATITVIGRDKTGVIARVTSFLFEQKANIEALEEQVTRGQFSMTLQASWKPAQLSPAGLKTGLAKLAKSLGMEIKLRFTDPKQRQRMAIFVTRETHCLEAIMAAFRKGHFKEAEPVVVVGSCPDLKSLAEKYKLPFVHVSWNERTVGEEKALALLEQYEIDFIVLARF